jgi:hypothetical protein
MTSSIAGSVAASPNTDIAAGVIVTVIGFFAGRAASRFAAGERPNVSPAPAMATSG